MSSSSSPLDIGLVMKLFIPDKKAYRLKASSWYAVQQHINGSGVARNVYDYVFQRFRMARATEGPSILGMLKSRRISLYIGPPFSKRFMTNSRALAPSNALSVLAYPFAAIIIQRISILMGSSSTTKISGVSSFSLCKSWSFYFSL